MTSKENKDAYGISKTYGHRQVFRLPMISDVLLSMSKWGKSLACIALE